MKKHNIILAILFVLLAVGLQAQNLLLNAELKLKRSAIPFWSTTQYLEKPYFKQLPGQGPEGKDALELDLARCTIFRQSDLKLVGGEKYRFGCYVRTENFVCKGGMSTIVIYPIGWPREVRTDPFPKDTNGKWVLLEKEVTMPESENGLFTYAFYSANTTGKLEICAPFVIPVSEKAMASSEPPPVWQKMLPRVVPYYPTLDKVNSKTGEIRFYVIYPVDGAYTDYVCHASVMLKNDKSVTKTVSFNEDGEATVLFGGLPEGEAKLHVEMRKAGTANAILSNDYSMSVYTPIAPTGKRLNNFVCELFRGKLENKTYTFTAYEEGWYRFAFTQAQEGAVAYLDGADEPVIEYRDGEESDTMRKLTMGSHKLRVSNSRPGAELIISHVPQLHYYPYRCVDYSYYKPEALAKQPIVNRFNMDLDFYKKTVFHLFNTMQIGGGWSPKAPYELEQDKELKRRGIRIIGNGGYDKKLWSQTDDFVKYIRESRQTATTDGICLDESGPADPLTVLLSLGEMGWKLQDYDKHVHTWLALHDNGYFNNPEIHRPLYAGVSNVSRGYGRAMLEVYASSVRDENVLKEYLSIFPRQMVGARECVPDAPKRSIIMMGGYIMPGVWNCNPYPQTDIKVFLDEFFYIYANDPRLADLDGFGCYGATYCDEENHRWLNLLFKHYCIEGNREKLSPKYGFKYNPDHVKSCDFENGLEDWTAEQAEKDSIIPRTVSGLGASIQRRRSYKDSKNGNTCVQLTRSAKAPNKISQMLTGLKPGNLYSLTYVTEDADDLNEAKNAHQPVVMPVALDNSDIIPERGYHFRLPVGWDGSWGQKKGNREVTTRKIIFRPKAENVLLTFSDWKSPEEPGAPIGQKQILNYIAVRPYFDGSLY